MSTSSPWPGPRRDAESSPPNPASVCYQRIFLIVGYLGVCITFFPVIPGLKRISKWLPVHRPI